MCYLTLSSSREGKRKKREKKQTLTPRNWADTCNQTSEMFEAVPSLAVGHVTLLKDTISQNTSARQMHSEYVINREKDIL